MENENPRPATTTAAEAEEEEAEMETFFALVRNFKEMRDRRRKEMATIGDDGGEADQSPEKRRKKTKPAPATWVPTFLREDFDEDFQVRGPPSVLPMPCNLIKEDTAAAAAAAAKKKKKMMKSDEECLDLNLAL